MTARSSHFENVTLLITHFNRSASLERLLTAFRRIDCHFADTVVSDDGSDAVHFEKLQALQEEFHFELVRAPRNAGLGNNLNKGQDAVKTGYTLYVQEDFEPTSIFPAHFRDALDFMETDPTLDMVRFYAFFDYPVKIPYGKGYSELKFKWLHPDHIKFFCYSDHPHLRRSGFFSKFGRYREGQSGDTTEFSMALQFIHRKGRALFFDAFSSLFNHVNSHTEPSTMARAHWRESNTPVIRFLRFLYLRFRWLKNTIQLLLTRSKP